MKAALYIRVSTTDQNADMQQAELTEFCRVRGWEIVDTYSDIGVSGIKGQYRAGLTRLLKDAQSHKFQALLVWKLDRFARSIRESLRNMETLERAGVRFISTTQSIDTDVNNPASRLVVSVLAAAAQFEGELIRERTTAGLRQYQRAMKEGKVGKTVHSRSGRNLPIGRPKKIVNRDEIIRLKQEKQLSLRQIAKQVGVGLGTVTRILQAVPKT